MYGARVVMARCKRPWKGRQVAIDGLYYVTEGFKISSIPLSKSERAHLKAVLGAFFSLKMVSLSMLGSGAVSGYGVRYGVRKMVQERPSNTNRAFSCSLPGNALLAGKVGNSHLKCPKRPRLTSTGATFAILPWIRSQFSREMWVR
jgi:hypothetical protein